MRDTPLNMPNRTLPHQPGNPVVNPEILGVDGLLEHGDDGFIHGVDGDVGRTVAAVWTPCRIHCQAATAATGVPSGYLAVTKKAYVYWMLSRAL